VLAAKNAVIDQVFGEAVDRVITLPDDGYKNLLLKWLTEIAPQEPAELILNSRDKQAFGTDLIGSVNKDRNDSSAIRLAEEAGEIGGGFVLRTARYEIDRTLDGIVAKLEEEMAPEIAAELFRGRVERL
jgi:V/A-type H+-transporting ATPase subunit E